jgi:hypothetical protein
MGVRDVTIAQSIFVDPASIDSEGTRQRCGLDLTLTTHWLTAGSNVSLRWAP